MSQATSSNGTSKLVTSNNGTVDDGRLKPKDLINHFDVSEATIYAWIHGDVIPHEVHICNRGKNTTKTTYRYSFSPEVIDLIDGVISSHIPLIRGKCMRKLSDVIRLETGRFLK